MFTLAGHNVSDENESANSEGMLTDLADKVSNIEAEMHALEEEYQKDLLDHKQVSKKYFLTEVFNGCDTVIFLWLYVDYFINDKKQLENHNIS